MVKIKGKNISSIDIVKEYEESLENLALFGVERKPTGNPIGVNIDVPARGGS